MKKKIFIVAGEKSGDLLGSKIAKSLDKDKFEVSGIGGNMMKKEGVKLFSNIADISVMGIFEVLPKIFKICKKIRETAEYVVDSEQDILLTVDAPDFCFRVSKLVKKLDKKNRIKKAHFIAPSVWIYRKGRAKKIAKIYDILFCILPFEPPYFEKYGLKSIFVGHPIFDKNSTEYLFNDKEVRYNTNSKIISITAGSRRSEVKMLLPIILGAVKKLKEKYSDLEYHILGTENTVDLSNKILKKFNCDFVKIDLTQEEKDKILSNSLMAIAKSGTNTFEIAGYSVPMVVIYRFNLFTNIIAKILQIINKVKFVNIINIMNKRFVIPELVLWNCNKKNIYNESCKLIENEKLRKEQVRNNIDTIKILGYGNGSNYSIENIINKINEL